MMSKLHRAGRRRGRHLASLAVAAPVLLALSGCGVQPTAGSSVEANTLPTCSPQRAAGAVTPYERALLDTIATTEGTYGYDANDGYDVAFGDNIFPDCTQHPAVEYCYGICSDASGRYQFLSSTWEGLGYPNFYPNYQDQGAMRLARGRASIPSDRPMTYDEFVAAMGNCDKSTGQGLALEWGSLPPGCYGQPSRTMAEAWQIYSGFVAKANGTFVMHQGDSRTSSDGRFTLIMQSDGNLVLYGQLTAYSPRRPLWATGTNHNGGYVADMQGDGNFVVYNSAHAPLWASNTAGHAGAYLVVQNDGNTVIYAPDGAPLWATKTVQPVPPTCSSTEIYDSSYGGRYFWTCDLDGDGGRFICDANGYKTTDACANGCVPGGVGANDVCAGSATCTAAEQSASAYNGSFYWTCDLNGDAGRFICDASGHKTAETCSTYCVGEGVGQDDICSPSQTR